MGYIYLQSFTDKAAYEVKEAFLDLKKNHRIKSLILDLRGNPGGILDEALQIINYFVPKGTEVLSTRGRIGQWDKTYKTTQKPIDEKIPLAILINSESASASEIVSGTLQDLDRAVVIGERSFGKGLVQTTRPLPYNGMIKITTSKYYIPSGRSIQAIDYSHRNAAGRPERIPDSLTTAYTTAGGRIVRDGGGITPDVKIELPQIPNIVFYLVNDMYTFRFATQYAQKHDTIAPIEKFVITDEIYDEFKDYVKDKGFTYDRRTQKVLDELRKWAEFEGYLSDIDVEIDSLSKNCRIISTTTSPTSGKKSPNNLHSKSSNGTITRKAKSARVSKTTLSWNGPRRYCSIRNNTGRYCSRPENRPKKKARNNERHDTSSETVPFLPAMRVGEIHR